MDMRELLIRRSVPVVINSFNQHYYLQNIVAKFLAAGFVNILIFDNRSSYPPLLDYLNSIKSDPRVLPIYYPQNFGPHYFFLKETHRLLGNIPFLYTDPDLDWDVLAEDYLTRLFDLSHKYRTFKVGSALTLPNEDTMKRDLSFQQSSTSAIPLIDWESQYWKHELEPHVYNAPIDTTLHLFNPQYYSTGQPLITGLRVAGPGFEVIHLPWYKDDPCPEEEVIYYQRLEKFSTWVKK